MDPLAPRSLKGTETTRKKISSYIKFFFFSYILCLKQKNLQTAQLQTAVSVTAADNNAWLLSRQQLHLISELFREIIAGQLGGQILVMIHIDFGSC